MRIDRKFAGSVLGSAIEKGAVHAEVYVRKFRSLRAEAREGKINALERSDGFGYSLRVIRDGRIGFSYSNDPSEVTAIAERAMQALRFTRGDEFLDIPIPEGGYPELETFDPEIAGMDSEGAMDLAMEVEKAALESDSRVKKTRKSSAAFSAYEVYVLNSNRLSFGYEATSGSAAVTAIAEEKGDSQMGWGYEGGRFLREMDFRRAGQEAASRASSMLGAGRAVSSKTSIILQNSVAVDFLSVAASMLNAENVQKKKSLLEGKQGKAIMSRLINIIDNPMAPGSPARKPMDGEGVRCRENILVHEGRLEGYMHNTYTAKKGGLTTTGNALRGGTQSMPGVGPQSMTLESAGEPVTIKQMTGGLDSGLIVLEAMGVHTINPVSGDFSIGVSGITIKKGVHMGPVKEAVISGNILELLSSVEAVGDDLRYYGSMGAPSLLVSGVDLSA
jgi:PmbA protein